MALKSILLCICKLQLHFFLFQIMCLLMNNYRKTILLLIVIYWLFFSSLENRKGAVTLCLARLDLAQLGLGNHVAMWIQSINICENNVIPKVSSSQMVPVLTNAARVFFRKTISVEIPAFSFRIYSWSIWPRERQRASSTRSVYLWLPL